LEIESMSTVDDLMSLAERCFSAANKPPITEKRLRAALEAALRAEYERGRSEQDAEPLTDEPGAFLAWWKSAPHRLKYDNTHPAFLAAYEAWVGSMRAHGISDE
jgi:hypothetical protein